jgi:undecaprenyl-diphosphatase
MDFFSSVVLGILQGFTEFLPVSSSGHLVLIQSLMPNFSQPGVLFYVFLHLGTLFAVLIYFRKIIFKLPLKYYLFIVTATVPAALVGFFFQSKVEVFFTNYKIVGFALIVTGVMNILTNRIKHRSQKLTYKSSFITGIGQAIALIPGISRSGTTIFASVAQGINKETAAQFSFLLAVPAILGANILQLIDYGLKEISDPSAYITGFIFAFISGYLAIKIVFKFLAKNTFKYFGIYCISLGLFAVIFLK